MPVSNREVWLTVSRTHSGAWSVKTSGRRPPSVTVIELDTDEPDAEATRVITDAVSGVGDLIWRHELASTAYQSHCQAIGLAQQLAAAARAGNETIAAVLNDSRVAGKVAYALRAILSQRAKVRGFRRQMWLARLRWYLATAPAWIALLSSVLRYGGSDPTIVRPQKVAHAVHGELETRTRHLLFPRYEASAESIYFILGRPRRRLANLASVIDPGGTSSPRKTLVRPVDVRAVVCSFAGGIRQIAAGVTDAASSPIRNEFRESIALEFRIFLGTAHRHWWRRVSSSPQTVVFGHTGNADTSQLEMEMQAKGTKTMHLVHGVNHGWPFAGISSVGLFLSQHDAALARAIGSYKSTTTLTAPQPAYQPGSNGWLLLTSYTHPMARSYAAHGIELDAYVMGIVSEAAKIAGMAANEIIWHPHPSIANVSPQDREAVRTLAADHGFTEWRGGEILTHLTQFSAIITTPSTILLDALRLGKCPILVSAGRIQTDLIYAAYPVRADTAVELAELCTAADGGDNFSKAWRSITPGRLPSTTAELPI